MKFSNVFKTFSDSILLPNRRERHDLTSKSIEYTGTEMSDYNDSELQYLEEQIHASRKQFTTQKQEIIIAPNYGTQDTSEKVSTNGLFLDAISSTEIDDIEDKQNREYKIEDNSYRDNVRSSTYFIPDTTDNINNNYDNDNELSDHQWEANLESEKRKQYYTSSDRTRENKNELRNNFNITIMLPVNTTVQRYMGFARRKIVPTEKQVLHFYDNPYNRIEEISKEDDSSVLVL